MFTSITKLLTQTPVRMFAKQQKVVRPWGESKLIVAGCQGQIGVPLTKALVKELGAENVIATDLEAQKFDLPCRFEQLDICDESKYRKIVADNKVTYIVHLAGILSALGERKPDLSIDVNVMGAINAMRIARDNNCQIFIPSTIGVFGGDHFPKKNTPVDVILQPRTIYGVGKVFNEMLGEYFSNKYNMDFRSLRYPGVISSEKYAFNGTTDYSTEIFFHLLEKGEYKCFLKEDAELPMIYIDDCIDATIRYLKADPNKLLRSVYNLAGISFTPKQLADAIAKIIPNTKVTYEPDYRQAIAESWPNSLEDKDCYRDWSWQYDISTYDLAKKIYDGIDKKYKVKK